MALKASELLKLQNAFNNIKTQVTDACIETISEICVDIYDESRADVPVQTKNLQKSLEKNTPSYAINRGENEISGEVHFGEPGHIGGWYDTEAYTYMWQPGGNEDNWHGEILYRSWNRNKDRIIPELTEKIKSKL